MSKLARHRPQMGLANVSCILVYSPLRMMRAPVRRGRFGALGLDLGSKGAHVARSRGTPNLATTLATSTATCPRSLPYTPIARSMVGSRLLCTISAGTVEYE